MTKQEYEKEIQAIMDKWHVNEPTARDFFSISDGRPGDCIEIMPNGERRAHASPSTIADMVRK